MKLYNKIWIFFIVIGFASCNNISDLNINEDIAPSANPKEVLTSAQGFMSYVVDGQYNRRSFVWGQYVTWGPGVAIGNIERYVSDANDYSNMWARMYNGALTDLDYIESSDAGKHAGVAKIMKAYIYQGLVDHFGDVPYSEALKGLEVDGSIFSPKYDDDKEIYDQLIPLIDAGMVLLDSDSDDIGSEDLIYGGDADKWKKFANTLKLRILMRQSQLNDSSIDSQISSLIANGNFIESMDEMGEMAFNGVTGDENPMYAISEVSLGNFHIASNTSLNLLGENADPRIGVIYNTAVDFPDDIIGIDQGSIDNEPFTTPRSAYSQYSEKMYNNDNPVIFISTWEAWFLRAEAAARYGGDDEGMLANAVNAHFDYLGAEGASGVIDALGYSSGLSLDEKLATIGIQKWIAMNGLQEDEGWIETRRFDTPTNNVFRSGVFQTPTISVLGEDVHPSIWLYPQSELSFNTNRPAQHSLTDKVFWDN